MTTLVDQSAVIDLSPRKKSAADRLEKLLLGMTECKFSEDIPLAHHFAPGVYIREIFMSAGQLLVGHEHTTEHFNIVLTGRATVAIDGKTQEIVAPCIFVSKPGVRKALLIHEDMRWATVHVNPEDVNDIEKLEEVLVIKSPEFKKRETERLIELTKKELQ